MEKELAFEIVAKIIHDRGVELIVGGNPAFEKGKQLSPGPGETGRNGPGRCEDDLPQ